MPKPEQLPIEELRVGMSDTHAFIIFTPPVDRAQLSESDFAEYPSEENKVIQHQKKKRRVLVFPKGSFGWNSEEREQEFLHTSVVLGSELGVAKLLVGSLVLSDEKPVNDLLQGDVEVVPLT